VSRRLRVLLIAEACNPEWTSVPLEGWSHARAIARLCDAHLVTQVRNREAILRTRLLEGREFTAIDSEALTRPAYRLAEILRGGSGRGWTTVMAMSALTYRYFEHLLWKQFGSRIRAGEFDVVHRLTPLSPTVASPIAGNCRRAGVPFVLGPLNGGVPWPKGFDDVRRGEREWLSYVRGAYKLLPGYRATRRNAAAILVGSRDTWQQMPARYHDKCVYVPENAVDPTRFTRRRTRQAARPLRAVFVGRLVPYKGADMLLEAAAPLVRSGALTLEILGDGPQMPELKRIVEREGIAHGVCLAGWVPHTQLQDRLLEADIFAFPSIREFGGAVVLEAMAVGLVPIVVNYGGPGELVTPDTGYLVELGSRAEIVERFRWVLEELSADPSKVEDRSPLCVRCVREQFTWDAKARQVVGVYEKLSGENSRRPERAEAVGEIGMLT
jgi:glycosyltransferase involved in cell wall biosynthesis